MFINKILNRQDRLYAASMYSGAENIGGAKGFQSGYDFAVKAERAEQDAKIKGEQIKKAQMETALRNEAFEDVMNEDMSPEQQHIIYLENQVKKNNANTVKANINEVARATNSKDRNEVLNTVLNRINSNPDAWAAMGIKNPKTMTILNYNDAQDRKWMIDTLKAQGVEASSPEEWDNIVRTAIDGYPAIKVDGVIVDINGLGAATGATSQASPKHRQIMEQNLSALRNKIYADQTMDISISSDGVKLGDKEFKTADEALEYAKKNNIVLSEQDKKMLTGAKKAYSEMTPEERQKAVNGNKEVISDYNFQTDTFTFTKPDGTVVSIKNTGGMTMDDAEAMFKKEHGDMKITPGPLSNTVNAEGTTAAAVKTPNGVAVSKTVTPETTADIENTKKEVKTAVNEIERTKKKEGFRSKPYKDGAGYSIGYGHQIKPGEEHLMNGITQEQADILLQKDMAQHTAGLLKASPWVKDMPENVQVALRDMAYNMGPGFMKKFPNLEKALKEGDYKKAADIVRNSKYASQVHGRALENAALIDGSDYKGVASQVSDYIRSSGGAPLDDMRMRKIYALLGKNYPRDPNEPTAMMKNFEFLSDMVGPDKALDAVFGVESDEDEFGRSRVGKTLKDAMEAKARGDMEQYEILMDAAKKQANKETATQYGYNKAMDKKYELDQIAKERDLTEAEQVEYKSALETIENYEKTASQQTRDANLKMQTQAHEMANKHANEIAEARKTGKEITAEAIGDLKRAQQMYRASGDKLSIAADKKILEPMRANQEAAIEIDSVMNRLDKGDLKPMRKGIVDNAIQMLGTKVSENLIPESRKETIEANIKAGSVLGYLQATLIRAMSGTAASEAEVKRLQNVMQGAEWNQEWALKAALKEFRDGLIRRQNTLSNQLSVSPYDAYRLTQMNAPNRVSKTKKENRPSRTINGETRYWDGTKWVK